MNNHSMTRPAIAMTPAIMAPVTSRPGAAPLVRDADGAGVVLVGELVDKLRSVEELPVDAEDDDCTGVELGLKGVDNGVAMLVELEEVTEGLIEVDIDIDDDDVDVVKVEVKVVRALTMVMVVV